MIKLKIIGVTKVIKKAIKKTFLLLFLLPSYFLLAGEKIDQMIDVSSLETIKIDNNRGKVIVEGWDENKIKIVGELDDLTEKFVFFSKNKITSIQIIIAQKNQHLRSGKGSNIKIFVPKNSSLEYSGNSSILNFSKIYRGLNVKSVSGNITLTDIHKNINISNSSGDITALNITGKINISSVSGEINIKADSNYLTLKTVSSNIVAKLNQCHQVEITTVSGAAKLTGRLVEDGSIVLSNVTGESYYYVTELLSSEVLVEASPSGMIVNEFSDKMPKTSHIGSKELQFKANDGKANIKLFTVSGSAGLKLNKS
jgi:hypothetical protein